MIFISSILVIASIFACAVSLDEAARGNKLAMTVFRTSAAGFVLSVVLLALS